MDIATIIGIVSGFGLIFTSLAIGSGGIMGFYNLPSILIVFGGSLAAILIMFPFGSVMATFKVAMKAFMHKLDTPEDVIHKMLILAKKVRQDGILALEKEVVTDHFFAKGISLCVDGHKAGSIRGIMTTELNNLEDRHATGQDVFEQMGAMAPAFGMIGTLIGLVQMLQTLSDPASIGPSMAVALLTTFYGAVIANLICIPIAKKLEFRSKEEQLIKKLIIEGVVAIANHENPHSIHSKLEGFLSPHKRKEKPKK